MVHLYRYVLYSELFHLIYYSLCQGRVELDSNEQQSSKYPCQDREINAETVNAGAVSND